MLTHEVVHGGLLQSDRQARHRRTAEMLERLYRGRTEEVCDLLAHRWAQSDLRARAHDGAMTVGANREAIGHLEAALEMVIGRVVPASDAEIAGLRLKLAGLHFIVGER